MANITSRPKNWRPSLLLQISAALHGLAIAFLLLLPDYWQGVIAVIIPDHLIIIAAGLLPRCQLLGVNWSQLPEFACANNQIAITIDDGPDPEVTPQVLAILERYQAKASFFCIAQQAEKYPELCRQIIQAGHAVENHSYHHWHYFSVLIRPAQIRTEIQRAQTTLAAITAVPPLFFRPTAGLRNFLVDPILSELGLQLASWTKRGFDTRQTDPAIVLKKLLKNLRAGDILLLHDGNAARTKAGTAVILTVLPMLLDAIANAKLQPVTLRSLLP